MERFLKKFAEIITRRPLINIILITCITLFWGWQMTHLTINNDLKNMIPQDDPVIKFEDAVNKTFGVTYNQVIIGVVAKDVFSPTTLAKVERIVNKVKAIKGVDAGQVIALPTIQDIKGNESGFETTPLWQDTPTTTGQAQRLKDAVLANKFLAGSIVSKDGTATAILAPFPEDVTPAEIHAQIKAITDKEEGPERIYLGGTPIAGAVLDSYAQKIGFLLILAILGIMAVLYWSFRSIRGVIIPLTTATLSNVWMLGLMGLLRIPLDTFSMTLPILIIAIGSGHSVQVVKRYYELIAAGKDKAAAVKGAVAKAGLAMVTAGLTSAAGFGSLATFHLRFIQNFGVFCAVGILSVLVLELTFVPAWQMLLPAPKKKPAAGKGLDLALASLGKHLTSKPVIVLTAAAVLLVAGLSGAAFLKVEGNMTSTLKPDSELRVAERVLGEKFGGSSMIYLIVKGQGPDAIKDPAVLHYIEGLQNYAKTLPGVGNTASIADYIKRLNQAMNGDRPEFDRIPETQDLIAQYLLLYSMSGDTGSLNNVVDFNYQAANIMLTLRDSSTALTSAVVDAIKQYIAGHPFSGVSVGFSGSSILFQRITDIIVREKILNILQTAGIIFAICALIFRSLAGGLFAILPLTLAVVLNFGLMGWLGIPLDMATATLSGMAIGIGADYAIYYLLRHTQEYVGAESTGTAGHATAVRASMLTTGRAIVTTALAITVGFLALTFSEFGGHRTLGFLVAFSMVTSSLGALTILPAALALFKPKFASRSALYVATNPGAGEVNEPAQS